MYTYRHIHYAGNFADVFKHVLLVGLIDSLRHKDSGIRVHDTHAGVGLYDMTSKQACKNREFAQGYARVLDAAEPPSWVQKYVEIIKDVNEKGKLHFYPGSPMVARRLLRPQDSMLLTELDNIEHAELKAGFHRDKQVAVHLQDAWQGLKAFLPPKQKRGLVLIDPPYVRKDEPKDLQHGIQTAYQRWPTGMYAIWYPVFTDKFAELLRKRIIGTGIRKILDCQLIVRGEEEGKRMIGTGMMIINPPWQFDQQLKAVLPWLQNVLAEKGKGNHALKWLVRE